MKTLYKQSIKYIFNNLLTLDFILTASTNKHTTTTYIVAEDYSVCFIQIIVVALGGLAVRVCAVR